MSGSSRPIIRAEVGNLGAKIAVDSFVSITRCPTEDPAEVLGQLLAGLRNHYLERFGSDAVWGESVAVMRRALEEVDRR